MSSPPRQPSSFHRFFSRFTSPKHNKVDLRGSTFTNVDGDQFNHTVNVYGGGEDVLLDDLPYAYGAGYMPEKACLAGTRTEMIETILEWANDSNSPVIFWLTGFAGSGKSSISHSVAEMFDVQGRLGSAYFFDRTFRASRWPGNLFSTIALNMANKDRSRMQALLDIVRDDFELRVTESAERQFNKLLVEPRGTTNSKETVFIIIDALDESGDRSERVSLLGILADPVKTSRLPPHVRILLTSRPEQDIIEALSKKSHVLAKKMDDIERKLTDRDIATFVRHHLSGIHALEKYWPQQEWCNIVVEKSEGLFQWASAACLFINGTGKRRNPLKQFRIVITSGSQIHELYLTVLKGIFDEHDEEAMQSFRDVLSRVLASKQPLTLESLEQSFADNQAEFVIAPMGPLLSGTSGTDLIRPLHTTFRDFLETPEQSGPFYIDIPRMEKTSSSH